VQQNAILEYRKCAYAVARKWRLKITDKPQNKALHPTAYSSVRRSSSLRFRRRVSLSLGGGAQLSKSRNVFINITGKSTLSPSSRRSCWEYSRQISASVSRLVHYFCFSSAGFYYWCFGRCNFVACCGSTRVEYLRLSGIAFIAVASQAQSFIICVFGRCGVVSCCRSFRVELLWSPCVRRVQWEYSGRNCCGCKLASFIVAAKTNQPLPNKALHPTAYSSVRSVRRSSSLRSLRFRRRVSLSLARRAKHSWAQYVYNQKYDG
jgi:hypothetical protein